MQDCVLNPGMKKFTKLARVFAVAFLSAPLVADQQPFPVISTVNESTIAGRPVALDNEGKLLPWPIPITLDTRILHISFRNGRLSGTNTIASGCPIISAASISTAQPLN
jgi:hypothetical protein